MRDARDERFVVDPLLPPDMLAEAAADVPGAIPDGADPGGGTALEAARRTLEARIGEAVQANRWLLDAARRSAGEAAERRRPEPR